MVLDLGFGIVTEDKRKKVAASGPSLTEFKSSPSLSGCVILGKNYPTLINIVFFPLLGMILSAAS